MENGISLNKFSELMSKKPAEILGMNKGLISVGYDGDMVLLDLNKEIVVNKETFLSKGKNTALHGRKYFGEVMITIRKGKIVYKS